jgi:Spy/CpxP family protein refolding chaperone
MNVYPQQMEAVLQAIAQDLSRISEAVRDGKLTREQGEYLSVEQYYVGLLRFQLLRALYQNANDANPEVSSPQASTVPKVLGNTVVTAAPTPSADISEQAAAFLELTPAQIAAIQAAISDDRKTTQPLVDEFENNRRELNFLTSGSPLDADKLQALAAEQGRIVEQFIVSNALLESKLYGMLSQEQKEKINALLQTPH